MWQGSVAERQLTGSGAVAASTDFLSVAYPKLYKEFHQQEFLESGKMGPTCVNDNPLLWVKGVAHHTGVGGYGFHIDGGR